MHPSPSPTISPAHSLLRDMRYTMIPHQIRGVTAGLAALDLEANPAQLSAHTEPGGNSEAVSYDNLSAYTRPVICVAAIHCRAILQFLGLQSNGSSSPDIVSRNRHNIRGVWIGTFNEADGTPLESVPPSVIQRFPDPQEIAQAWAATYDFAAQRLTDAMADPRLISATITPMLRKTFETVPAVIGEWFYERAALHANA